MVKNKFINIISIIIIIMEMTTIAISKELRNKLRDISNKGKSYDEIIEDMYETYKVQVLKEMLMDSSNSISIEQALKEAKDKWG